MPGFIKHTPESPHYKPVPKSIGKYIQAAPIQPLTSKATVGGANGFWKKRKNLNFDFLERCKEIFCRIPHPNNMMRRRGVVYHVSKMYWSRAGYIDIRTYVRGTATGRGIFLHLDVIKAMLPELIAAVRELEAADNRDPETIQPVEVWRH